MFTIKRRALAAAVLAGGWPGIRAVRAAETLTVVTTTAATAAPIMVGVADGLFAKQGLAVRAQLVPLMPNIPAILVSNSAQIGFLTTPTLLQAVDGGLDLVAIAGGGVSDPAVPDAAAIARADLAIEKPTDFLGKTVGVPGLGAYYHVIFRWWLMSRGVDPGGVHFVETAFPVMLDALRGKSVDAVVCLDPFQSQILGAGVGRIAVPIYRDVPRNLPIVLYVTTRDWANAHRQEVAAFRSAIAQAQVATVRDPERAKALFNEMAKLPPAVLPRVSIGAQSAEMPPEGFAWWVEVMTAQKMLASKPDVSKLVFG